MARMQNGLWFGTLLVQISLLPVGCGTPGVVKSYPGPTLPDGQVATLVVPTIINVVLDGQELSLPGMVKMLPGPHEIAWSGRHQGANFTYQGRGTLQAEAGRQYLIRTDFQESIEQSTSHRLAVKAFATWIEDGETGEALVSERPSWSSPAAHLTFAFPLGGMPYPLSTERDTTVGAVLRLAPKDNHPLRYKLSLFTYVRQPSGKWGHSEMALETADTYSATSGKDRYSVVTTQTINGETTTASRYTVDERNRVVEIAQGEQVLKGALRLVYPEEPVRVGFTWGCPRPDKEPGPTLERNWRCLGFADVETYHCVVIETLDSRTTDSAVDGATQHTKVEERNLEYIDRDSGCSVCAYGETTTTVTVNQDPTVRTTVYLQSLKKLISK